MGTKHTFTNHAMHYFYNTVHRIIILPGINTLVNMKNKKGINFFLVLIAIILGSVLYKHFDFKNFSFADPYLDMLYLVVFIVCIFLIIKDYKKQPEK